MDKSREELEKEYAEATAMRETATSSLSLNHR